MRLGIEIIGDIVWIVFIVCVWLGGSGKIVDGAGFAFVALDHSKNNEYYITIN